MITAAVLQMKGEAMTTSRPDGGDAIGFGACSYAVNVIHLLSEHHLLAWSFMFGGTKRYSVPQENSLAFLLQLSGQDPSSISIPTRGMVEKAKVCHHGARIDSFPLSHVRRIQYMWQVVCIRFSPQERVDLVLSAGV